MSKIKVMIVDDSAVVRQVISGIIDAAPGMEVLCTAQDPVFAQKRMQRGDRPDVMTLDIEMPNMDGLSFLKQIMKTDPLPVVMCSTLTEKGSRSSMQALEIGAVEAIAKPKSNVRGAADDIARELVDAIRAAAQSNIKALKRTVQAAPPARVNKDSAVAGPAAVQEKLTADVMLAASKGRSTVSSSKLVAIGTSTGGTQALEVILPRLKPTVPGIVIVQHMPEKFTAAFAERLNGICAIEVREAHTGDVVSDGLALVAPGGKHMMVENKMGKLVVVVKDGPLVCRHRPSVDVLFRSVSRASGPNALGIIMTGMGDDGAAGLKEMHDCGAHTLAQNKATSVIYGMPAVAVARGGVDRQLPLEEIPMAIASYGTQSVRAMKTGT